MKHCYTTGSIKHITIIINIIVIFNSWKSVYKRVVLITNRHKKMNWQKLRRLMVILISQEYQHDGRLLFWLYVLPYCNSNQVRMFLSRSENEANVYNNKEKEQKGISTLSWTSTLYCNCSRIKNINFWPDLAVMSQSHPKMLRAATWCARTFWWITLQLRGFLPLWDVPNYNKK